MINNKNLNFTPEKLRSRYILALSIVAVLIIISQIFIQVSIQSQAHDSHVINIAGRQRMLSQKITKTVMYLYSESDKTKIVEYKNQLKGALELWTKSHKGLQYGDESNGLPGNNSKSVHNLFSDIQNNFTDIQAAANRLLNIDYADMNNRTKINDLIKIIQLNEPVFLKGMDQIVTQYDVEAYSKVDDMRRIEILLMVFTLSVLVIEAFTIFRPAKNMLEKTLDSLQENEENLKKLFDVAPSVMFLINPDDLKIIRLNEPATALTTYSYDQCMGRSLYEFIEGKYLAVFDSITKDKYQGIVKGIEIVFRNRNEEHHIMLMSISRIYYNDKPAYLVGFSDITELKESENMLSKLATKDDMTGLFNRRTGLEILKVEIERTKRYKEPLSIAFLDLNGLKIINDTYGHEEGDFLIRGFADVIKEGIRTSDSILRYGGDEFIIIFPNCGFQEASMILERINISVKYTNIFADKPYGLSFSYGLSEYDIDGQWTLETLINSADSAMYEMKELHHKNRNNRHS